VKYLRVPYDLVTSLAHETRASLLVGSIDVIAQAEPPKTKAMYNAAFFVEPDKALTEPYRKMRLVPFGEYVPLSKWLPFMKKLTPIQGGFDAGTEFTIFPLNSASASFGVVICFEDVMPDHCRQFAARGADFLVTITNDAWFGRTAGAYQHAANSVFRAVENRRPLLRCANTGMTCVVDARGRIVKILEGAPQEKIFVQGVLTHTLQLPENPPTTFYTRHGNVFAWSCSALSALAIALCALKRRNRPREANALSVSG
jgi:apolipoprotein N-acyltransferase